MKLIILAAGTGSRLKPLTINRPKCLLPLGETTIIEKIINQFKKYGVTKVTIVTGHCAHKIKSIYDKKHKILYYSKYKKFNNFDTLWSVRKELTEDSIITFSDLIIEDRIIKKLLNSKYKATVTIDTSGLRKDTMFISHKKNLLKSIAITTKKDATGNFIGIFLIRKIITKTFLNHMSSLLKNSKSDYYVKVLNSMIQNNIKINTIDIKGKYWREVDTVKEYKLAQKENKLF